MSLQLKLIGAVVTLFWIAASVWMYGSSQYKKGAESMRTMYAHAIDTQKIEAAKTLADETARVAMATQALQTAKDQQELKDAKNKSTVATLANRLRDATDSAGRLRDPNAAGCGGGSDSASSDIASRADNRADNAAEAGGVFSRPATELFARLTREADEVNAAYASCRADAYSMRGIEPP